MTKKKRKKKKGVAVTEHLDRETFDRRQIAKTRVLSTREHLKSVQLLHF